MTLPGDFAGWVELAGRLVDAAGVVTITLGIGLVTGIAVVRLARGRGPALGGSVPDGTAAQRSAPAGTPQGVYQGFRQQLGRAILLGLELSWPLTSSGRSL